MRIITPPENIGAHRHLRIAMFTRFDDMDYTRVSAGLADALQPMLYDPVADAAPLNGVVRGAVIDVLAML